MKFEKNAFTINRLGGTFFPFSLKISTHENLTDMFLCAQRVVDVCDLLETHAADYLAVFAFESTLYDEYTDLRFSLERLAGQAQIFYTAVDSETIIIPKKALKTLLLKYGHNNLSMFDLGTDWEEDRVIEQVITCREHDWGSRELLLSKISASHLFLDSHDDCYLTVQADRTTLSQQIFRRTLRLYTGTVLAEAQKIQPRITEISEEQVGIFWGENFGLTILREFTEIKNGILHIGVSKKAFDFSQSAAYDPDFRLRYDIKTGQWWVEI